MTDEKEWLVSDKTCKGCMHYGMLSWSSKTRACLYTCNTGKIRTDKPKECTVKKYGKPPNLDDLRKHWKYPMKEKV